MTTRRQSLKVAAPGADEGVTTLELFFDLVFVFAVTQLTQLLLASDGAGGYGRAALVLAVTWWMYDGYAWLSNNVDPRTTSTRLPMLVAMACFLVMAIATPEAFGDAAWAFAIAYLVVVLVHAASFARSTVGGSAVAVRGILPVNLAAALCLVGAAAAGEDHGWIGWVAAVSVLGLSVALRREAGFTIRPGHFAERHQLLIIIALGETVVATGVGAQDHITDAAVLTAAILSLALIAAMWWVYFTGDDERALERLEASPPERMSSDALWAYGLAHPVMIAGLVMVAAGLHEVVHAPGHHLAARWAWTMAGGLAVYLAGEAMFRRRLGGGPVAPTLLAGAACLLTVPLGTAGSGLAQLAGLTALLVVWLVLRAAREGAEPA